DHCDGADRKQAAVPLLPARTPLRAELPRPPPTRPLWGRTLPGLRDGHPGNGRDRDCRGDRARGRLPAGRAGRCRPGGGHDRRAPLRRFATTSFGGWIPRSSCAMTREMHKHLLLSACLLALAVVLALAGVASWAT